MQPFDHELLTAHLVARQTSAAPWTAVFTGHGVTTVRRGLPQQQWVTSPGYVTANGATTTYGKERILAKPRFVKQTQPIEDGPPNIKMEGIRYDRQQANKDNIIRPTNLENTTSSANVVRTVEPQTSMFASAERLSNDEPPLRRCSRCGVPPPCVSGCSPPPPPNYHAAMSSPPPAGRYSSFWSERVRREFSYMYTDVDAAGENLSRHSGGGLTCIHHITPR
ncbi:hypothetical protein Bbelb_145220 [Branchiostoma belcheri]|nr:hypothetical protein Bbelb_145220 [Branchiostoma belcheri]